MVWFHVTVTMRVLECFGHCGFLRLGILIRILCWVLLHETMEFVAVMYVYMDLVLRDIYWGINVDVDLEPSNKSCLRQTFWWLGVSGKCVYGTKCCWGFFFWDKVLIWEFPSRTKCFWGVWLFYKLFMGIVPPGLSVSKKKFLGSVLPEMGVMKECAYRT